MRLLGHNRWPREQFSGQARALKPPLRHTINIPGIPSEAARPASFRRLAPAPPLASLLEGPWRKFVVKDRIKPSQGKGAASLRHGSRWAQTCVCTHGHTPRYPFIVCELGLTLRRRDPLKTTSILLLGSGFSAKTERGLRERKAEGFLISFLKKKKKRQVKKAAGAQACNLRTLKQVQGHLQSQSKLGASLGYGRKKKQRKENGPYFLFALAIITEKSLCPFSWSPKVG